MELTDSAARILAALLEARTGQQLTVSRNWRIETALRPLMRERGLTTLDELAASLVSGRDPRLANEAVEALLNNETFFFRDRTLFELIFKGALPRLKAARARQKRLSIWCAGCSTGQEAYSIAMSFAEQEAEWRGWTIDIVATDVSRTAVERAKAGLYSQFEVQRGLPVLQMMRWFKEEPRQQWRISPRLREAVRFHVHNLTEAPPPPPGRFDLILCRNVLLYFSPATTSHVFGKLDRAIAPDGRLVLGAGETTIGATEAFASDPDNRGLYIRSAAAELRAPHASFG